MNNTKPIALAKAVAKTKPRAFLPKTTAEWSYSYLIFFSALAIFLARFLTDGPVPAIGFLAPATIGYLFKWRKMPGLAIFLLAYFLFAPGMIPMSDSLTLLIRLGHFDLMNIILVGAALVYLTAQYRLYVLIDRVIPNEKPDAKKTDSDHFLRKIDAVPSGEFRRLFLMAGLSVVVAEFLWLGITELYVEPALSFPIRWAGPPMQEESHLPGSVIPSASRLILLIGSVGLFVAIARFAFWYWRLARIGQTEGAAIVADSGWSEIRREQRRNEYWRARALAGRKRESP